MNAPHTAQAVFKTTQWTEVLEAADPASPSDSQAFAELYLLAKEWRRDHRLRQRYGELLRLAIARTVSSPAEVDEELNHLIRVVGS